VKQERQQQQQQQQLKQANKVKTEVKRNKFF